MLCSGVRLCAEIAEKPYFKRFSGIEKGHRNSIKITVPYGPSGGARPALRRRPPRVETCHRHVSKCPRVRAQMGKEISNAPGGGIAYLVRVEGLEPPT